MNLRRALLIAAAAGAVALGSISLSLSGFVGGGKTEAAASCARCGDGVCARSCETAASCPRDCGGIPARR
jgi:hypothetical protein